MPIRTRTSLASGHSCVASARCASIAVFAASSARRKAKRNESPWLWTSAPRRSCAAVRRIRRCAARRSPYLPPSLLRSCVEPSMSVKRKVTVPVGRLDARTINPLYRAAVHRQRLLGARRAAGSAAFLARPQTLVVCGEDNDPSPAEPAEGGRRRPTLGIRGVGGLRALRSEGRKSGRG